MSAAGTRPAGIEAALALWLPEQRWYAAKNRRVDAVTVAAWAEIVHTDTTDLALALVDVSFTDGGPRHLYHVPLGRDSTDGGATVGETGWSDALAQPRLARLLLRLMTHRIEVDGVRMSADAPEIDPDHALVEPLGAEQSNTSIVYDRRLILKVFRRLSVGVNPDTELQHVLVHAGSTHVAGVRGVVETTLGGQPVTLALAQTYAADARDGWRDALDNLADRGDFALAAYEIGAAVAHVHRDLARELGSAPLSADGIDRLVADAAADLDAAVADTPQLRPYAPDIHAVYAGLHRSRRSRHGEIVVQRIHGDLHLGQMLRTPAGWWVLDFEGEPNRPIAERRAHRSPLYDVAGLLRSLDYAARHDAVAAAGAAGRDAMTGAGVVPDDAVDPDRWLYRARHGVFGGYASVSGRDPRADGPMLRIAELSRAVHEVAYEARHRPDWLPIPLAALDRLIRR
jgi:maltokinase